MTPPLFSYLKLPLCLLALLWLSGALAAESTAVLQEECISEPIFEGKVCTVQANHKAAVGVILIHGLGGSTDDWRNTLPLLANHFHVLAFDLPGFGKSDKGSQLYSPTAYARLVHYLADHYFADKTYHIVGHSMGGAIALRFAAQRPLRFQRLVLIDAAGILHPLVLSKFQAGSLIEGATGFQQTRPLAERISGRLLEIADKLPIKPDEIVNTPLGRDTLLQGGPEKIAALGLANENFSYAVETVTEPTLILWGDRDLTVPLRTGQVLAARLPHARLEVIADAAHEPMNEQAVRVNQLLIQHLLATPQALAQRFQSPPPREPNRSERIASCNNESGVEFSGDYLRIELNNCSAVTIRDARIGELLVNDSRATLLNTDIIKGLHAERSEVSVTNGTISGTTALTASYSRLDLAGVRLLASQDAVKAINSKLVFSICQIESAHSKGALHDFRSIADGVL